MREMIHTYCRGHELLLLWQPDAGEIEERIGEGFVPIEMAEGCVTYADFRELDHHNSYSHMPSACMTALKYYGDLAGERPARIMVNHTDSDSVMTGLTLLGLLPRGYLEQLNPEIAQMDTEPMIADRDAMKFIGMIELWKSGMESVKQSGWSWIAGLNLWLDMHDNPQAFEPAAESLRIRSEQRRRIAAEDMENGVLGESGRVMMIPASRVKGQYEQHMRIETAAADSLEGWRHWCLISRVAASGSVMIACPCRRVAESAFGPGGLMNVFPKLPQIGGKSWGGRESVGGSPRGCIFPEELMADVLKIVDDALITR